MPALSRAANSIENDAYAIQAAYDPSREFIRSQNTRYRWLPTNPRVT